MIHIQLPYLSGLVFGKENISGLLNFTSDLKSKIHVSAIGIIVNAITFALVSRFTRKLPDDHVQKFQKIVK